jgi:hypothetical protein
MRGLFVFVRKRGNVPVDDYSSVVCAVRVGEGGVDEAGARGEGFVHFVGWIEWK